jgi:Ecdysteroid kinase-like family
VNENYSSSILRVKIKIETEKKFEFFIDVILKCLTSDPGYSFFPREKLMYEEVLEKFEQIWKEQANETIQFGPKCMIVLSKPLQIFALDDLKAQNYKLIDKEIGINLNQAKMVLSKMSKLHASSALHYQKVYFI